MSENSKNGVETKKRVLVVDDHPVMRSGLRLLISATTDLEVCQECANAAEAVELANRAAPDVMVLDLGLPDRSGLDALKDILAVRADLRVLIVSVYDELFYAERTLRAGAKGYVMKDAGPDEILDAIRLILNGGISVSGRVTSWVLGGRRHPEQQLSLEKLSDREFEVFRLLGEGSNTRSIAERMKLSPKTVDTHRMNIKAKLGVSDGAQLVLKALRWSEAQRML